MPDITMCDNSSCSLNRSCYRYKATPNEFLQSYFIDLKPVLNENGTEQCEYYILPMNFNKELYEELKEHYNLAVEENRDQFVFHTEILLTSYAKYLIEFLKEKYESDHAST